MTQVFEQRLFPLLPDIVEEFGTPFHIVDMMGILETGRQMNIAFSETPYRQFFAVKALPDPYVMQWLRQETGSGFDCSSVPELALARGVGARGVDIMFTSNNTSADEFRVARKEGGCRLNLDDISLVSDVKDPFPREICFRINPGKQRTGNSIIGEPVKSKYGITVSQIVPAYRAARERGATTFGMHTMLCSNELRAGYMIDTVKMLLEFCILLKRRLGIKCAYVNMGGGFGIPYRPDQKPLALHWMAGQIVRLLENFEKEHGWRPELFSECGRYVTGPHGVLVTSVINEKRTYERYVGVDSGMQALMRPAMYDAYHHVDILDQLSGARISGPRKQMNVVGAICENIDRFASRRFLPKNTKKGNLVVVHDAGAHGLAMGFNYNGRLRPQMLALMPSGKVIQTRRAETMKDLFRTTIFPPGFKNS